MCYLHRAGHGLGALSDTHGMHTGFQHGEELLVRKRKAGQDAEAGAGETLCELTGGREVPESRVGGGFLVKMVPNLVNS